MAEKKKVTMEELRALPKEERQQRLGALRQELWQQRLKLKSGALQQTHGVKILRRQIARLLTVKGSA